MHLLHLPKAIRRKSSVVGDKFCAFKLDKLPIFLVHFFQQFMIIFL